MLTALINFSNSYATEIGMALVAIGVVICAKLYEYSSTEELK